MAEGKGKKLRRCTARSKARYALQFGISERNKKRKLSRHIRNNPDDIQAIFRFEQDMGSAKGLLSSLTGRGRYLEYRDIGNPLL